MSSNTANTVLRWLGTVSGLAAAAIGIARPEWEVVLEGGQTMRPTTWIWAEPDLSLVDEVSSHISLVPTARFVVGGLMCAWLFWYLGGLRRGRTTSPRS